MKTILFIIGTLLILTITATDTSDTSSDDKFDNEEIDFQDFGNDLIPEEKEETTNSDEEKVIKAQGLSIGMGKEGKITLTLRGADQAANVKTVYIRYGKTSCHSKGAKLLYSGYVGGENGGHYGGGVGYLCMPKNPHYLSSTKPSAGYGYLYGTEYETGNKIYGNNNYNVPCAVCQVPRSTKMTIPARITCPFGWTREYYGYLMTNNHGNAHSSTFECIDIYPENIPGSQANTGGAYFYFVQVHCKMGLPCGPYVANRAITCVVCTA